MRAALIALCALTACSASPGVGHGGDLDATIGFIPEGLERVVVEPSGVRWQVIERRVFAAVGDSVDLWVQRSEPASPFGEPTFTGLVPSCFGRPRWVSNPDTGLQEGACYLRRFGVRGDELLFQLRLGGDWTAATSVPISTIVSDGDGDGWSDATERLFATRADSVDSDRDGLPDPSDPNPLVADPPTTTPASTPAQAMTRLALSRSKACTPGKPLIVVGRDRLRQAFPDIPCTVVWRPLSAPAAAARTADAPASAMDQLTLDMVVREGGLARVIIELDDTDAARPVVRMQHLLGEEEFIFAPDGDEYSLVDRRIKVRGAP